MINVAFFTFNPFQENTYLLYDQTGECVIIDAGCYTPDEEKRLSRYIADKKLKPVLLLTTHGHIDHVLGNRYVMDTYNIDLAMHAGEVPVMDATKWYGETMGLKVAESAPPTRLLQAGDVVSFGKSELKVLYVPGHSPAHIAFYCHEQQFIVSGDVLFRGSIGRTDLPGGDFDTLIESIETQLFVLNDAVKVYSGHGQATTIGYERKHNPILLQPWAYR